MPTYRRLALLGLLLGLAPVSASGQTPSRDLVLTPIEELMNIRVTSVSRKEQRAGEVPAAVFVLTHEDIRRSGLRTLPELLRLVPGVQVAQVDASRWAVSVRGFNNLYANKLLVLIDGRSVYNRIFSGVFWGTQDIPVDDIERIEVVRGPGGAVWGANAMNGVINIVTKSAGDTPGALVSLSAGTNDQAQASVRYGGSAGPIQYRVSSQWSGHGVSFADGGAPAGDAANSMANLLRADWSRGRDSITVQGSVLANETKARWLENLWPGLGAMAPGALPDPDATASTSDVNALARWTHTRPSGAELQVQSFLTHRNVDNVTERQHERTADLDVQFYSKLGSRHDAVAGGGFRDDAYRADGSVMFDLLIPRGRRQVVNVFAQDEVSLPGRTRATVGSKFEHEGVTGWSVQPTARFGWDVVPGRHHLWIAASRAIRTPSAIELYLRFNYAAFPQPAGLPIVVGVVGNPGIRPEEFIDTEIGYRVQLGSHAGLDFTAFRGRYSGLVSSEAITPVFEATPAPAHIFMAERFGNLFGAETAGFEVAGHWAPAPWWRVDGSYSGLKLVPRLHGASHDQDLTAFDGSAPRHQWQIRPTAKLGPRVEMGGALYYVGRLRRLEIPAHTRADVRVELRLNRQLSVIVTGRNLLEPGHAEFHDGMSVGSTLVPRAVNARLAWRF